MNDDPFLHDLAFELGLDRSEVTPDYPINVADWDSLALFGIIGNIQRYYDVVVDAEQLKQCGTVGDLMAMIKSPRGAA